MISDILSPVTGLIVLSILWLLIIGLMVWVIARSTTPLSLKSKRMYLPPGLSRRERLKILIKEKKANIHADLFNYYVVMPDKESPVFSPSINQLAEAEFLVIEYLVPKHKSKIL